MPVDAVTVVGRDLVMIRRARSHLGDAPGYDPELTDERAYYDHLYSWWGYPPFWAPGYAYPPYPYGV